MNNPIHIGALNRRPVLAGSSGSEDEYGLDILSERWSCLKSRERTDKLALGTHRNGMYLVRIVPTLGRAQHVTLDYTWKGLLSGTLKPAIAEDSETLQTATKTTDAARREVEYLTKQTTYRYIARRRPTAPAHRTVMAQGLPVVKRSVITMADGERLNRIPPINLLNTLQFRVEDTVVATKTTPVVHTPYFEIEETVVRLLIGD